MSPLNNQQKQLIFDYYLGLSSQEETAEAEALISSSEQADEIYSTLKAALLPLDSIKPEPCPDYLVERTVLRLNNLARSSQRGLEELLAAEQGREVATASRCHNFRQRAAASAVIFIAAGIWFAPLNFVRQKYWQHQCQMQLARIFHGISNYSSDHNENPPAVATTTGQPWWKVGYQGKENYSNTRHIWLLVKGGYAKPSDFVCPGTEQGRATQRAIRKADSSGVIAGNDFPNREHITYSLRIMCQRPEEGHSPYRKALLADLNPLFEELQRDYSNPFKEVRLNKDLLTVNSINHQRRGQNVLFSDSSVSFVKMRHVGILEDDIFTLRGTDTYKGVEVPSCETDAFLAP